MLTNPNRFPAVHFTIIYSLSPSLFHSVAMAALPENGTTNGAPSPPTNDNLNIGFQRPEMHTEKLAGTAISYDRHVILCYKTHDTWPSRVETSDLHPLPKLLAGALKARKNDIPVKTLLTICEGKEGTEMLDGDVLLFPEMVKYRGLKEPDITSFVEEVIVNRKPWSTGVQETMTGSHIFVCSHRSRDKRCGFCGPILIKKFKEEAEVRGLENVSVTACSHVGGHKYAGNLIIYTVRDEKVCGHWYGYVTPNDVADLLDNHIGKGEIIERIWRGQMGIPPVKKAEQTIEQKLPNGNDLKVNEQSNKASNTKEETENGGGCCQGTANGFSCCRDEMSGTEKEVKKEFSKLNIFTRKWEKHEVLTTAAVIGAVVTIGVAYSFYKRVR
uniref:altered inheritance of mitochondria protein 32-like isoform X1 n=1 Tax=Erigeron canadensis TaxID=72917 RepID=UPI001CB96B82|nr:altered inheritance of mitochondria protein 32-like isoform X1 [Erigeron canadensis]